MHLTPTAKLANYHLDGGLEKFVLDRRRRGVSWRQIAYDLYDATDKQVGVSYEMLRRWFREDTRFTEEPQDEPNGGEGEAA